MTLMICFAHVLLVVMGYVPIVVEKIIDRLSLIKSIEEVTKGFLVL